MDRFWRNFIAVAASVLLLTLVARITLDGWIEYKVSTDSPKTIDPTVISCRMVKP
jgi:hypothetical protein